MKKLLWLAPVVAVFATLAAQPASALNLSLTAANVALQPYAGPYGNVAVTLIDATHAHIEFTSNVVGGNIYLFGDGGSVALSFNGHIGLDALTYGNAGVGFTPGPFSNDTSGQVDGFGDFNLIFNDFDGYTHSIDKMALDVRNISGTWASENDILVANAAGHRVAAHIFVTSNPANASNGALATGFASDGTAPPIPEPASMVLLGLGLAGSGGLGLVRRRRRRQ